MQKQIKIFFIAIIIFILNCSVSASNIKNYGEIRYDGTGIIDLLEKWYFIPDDKPEYKNINVSLEKWYLINHSSSWAEIPQFSNYSGNAWYRFSLYLEKIEDLGLFIPIQYSGSQLYLNGILIAETRPFNSMGLTPKIIGKPEYVKVDKNLLLEGKNILAVRTGYLNAAGGFNGTIKIGKYQNIRNQWVVYICWNVFLFSVNIYLSIYFLLFYFGRRKERYYLYFSGLSFVTGLFLSGYRSIILWIFDYSIVYYMFTYLGSIFAVIMLLFFIHSFLKQRLTIVSKIIFILFIFFATSVCIEYILTGELFYFHKYSYTVYIQVSSLAFLYLTWIAIRAFKDNVDYASRILLAMIIFSLSLLVSTFNYMGILPIPDITPEGYFLMTIIFASALASRFAQVHTDLETAHGDLKVLDRMKDEFLATTSHELRTPLHGIIGLTDAMITNSEKKLSFQHMRDVELIQKSAHRLNSLVDEILDFSKLRGEKVDLFLGEIDLKKIIPSVTSIVQGMVGSKSITLSQNVAPDVPVITGDRNRIEQVLLNLLTNAVKFTDVGAVVVVAAEAGEGVSIAVHDTGRGMDRDEVKRIWNPYEQGDESVRRSGEGTGLGLAICRYLVKLHGGTIDVDSEKGKGTTFTLWLPKEPRGDISGIRRERLEEAERFPSIVVMPPELEQAELEREVSENNAHSAESSGDELIMVVDDDPINLQILQRILTKEGYRVTTFLKGREALDALEKELPHLILLDLMLPEMSGYDIMLEVRQKYKDVFLPVIMVTARNQMEDMVKGFIFGCNDYLSKPFNPKELLVRVQNQLIMKNVFDSDRRLNPEMNDSTDKMDDYSLVNRSRLFRDAIDTLKQWEEIIAKDLDMSKTFLDSLMGVRVSNEKFDIHVHYDPLLKIGGDLYLVHELDDGRIRIFLADATGHGINASLNCISIMAEYNLMRNMDMSPAEILFMLNNRFLQMDSDHHIVFTCCITDIFPEKNTLVFASAGHPSQVMVNHFGEVQLCQARGVIMGLAENVPYENMEREFQPGSKLLLFTDGLIESYSESSADRRDIHDDERLYRVMAEMKKPKSMSDYCSRIITEMKGKGRKKRNEDDDLTLIALHYRQ